MSSTSDNGPSASAASTPSPAAAVSKRDIHGITFQKNKSESVHRWFPYVEGFAGSFVKDTLVKFDLFPGPILDPFGGCGSTAVECSVNSIQSWSVDINPFMVFVAQTKTSLNVNLNSVAFEKQKLKDALARNGTASISVINPLFLDKNYFSPKILKKIARLKAGISTIAEGKIRNLFRLALASILVPVSNLKRAPDLKFRDEQLEDAPVFEMFFDTIDQFSADILSFKGNRLAKARVIHDSARDIKRLGKDYNQKFRGTITSPPYLNGTNYCRNTKLESWVLDYMMTDSDLKKLRQKSITASINSTHLGLIESPASDSVKSLVHTVQQSAYDRRIPVMVNNYFSDMKQSLKHMYRLVKRGGDCILVVGDSMFGGVHIPTDVLLSEIGESVGFQMKGFNIVRERKSRGGAKLQETILHFRKG